MKIDHFAYEVSNMDDSIRFYTEKLGFRISFQKTIDEKQHEVFAVLEMDGGHLELIQALSDTNQPLPFEPVPVRLHATPHLAFTVEDFEKTLAWLASEGMPILYGPFVAAGVVKWMYVCDPDQNVIEFCQFLAS